ncbi:MAG: hypothetical protein J0I84_23385 [Terrimonas sp.]|nr:hypothetical protein [Terrimonas sp.]OJY90580.1 MAG: hypothetical protein BGP13_19330 [Sphingobacteriales bacterium 40-81]
MKKIFILPFIAMVFFSCQKEMSVDTINNGGNGNNPDPVVALEGNWSFLNLYMDVSSTATGSVSGIPLVAVTAYKTTSINNTGTLAFTTDNFSVTNMGYTLSDTAYVSYKGLYNEEEKIPFDFDIDPYSASGKYQKIGTDSLFFPNGSVFQGLEIDGQEITSSAASGAKYAIKSDTLLVYANVNVSKDSTISENGVSIKFRVDQKATTIGSFKKK